ncbi:hypothetical protein [Lactiplantibacillus argentoratensis]|uniref:Uncharacterized protein n=1 Tax=Lactiplantibacillus argentoratensis TaxID=271881 RepID=A0AAN1Q1T3_9LACO|nr:hypothetical protein [Lactiplantibacillus argentoratensis]AYJ36067.1 hypothetical protein LPA65_09990 [Lactiplantibacillus argentoratensis]AYJ36120.1 hypothetical protein LPA65_10305 [Lactiplantibacillus argentoratensis]AYJ36169.1 hypothetical protein LPA65_10620 [Lactiplantibacillus argentoratensis]GEO53974.1 hypothetical protein LPL03_20700 [Lactiplantibacillus argentoratensis]
MANEVINLPDYTVDYHQVPIIINNLEGLQASIAQYVSLKPKFEYEKSCSSIGSTRAAKLQEHNKIFFFDFYCTPKLSLRQRLARRWAK